MQRRPAMPEINKELLKKQALLIGTGVTLQLLGGVCFCAASLLAAREIAAQLKKHIHTLTEV